MTVSTFAINLGMSLIGLCLIVAFVSWHVYNLINRLIARIDRLEAQMKTVKTHLKAGVL